MILNNYACVDKTRFITELEIAKQIVETSPE
jgi:hypothetical protein